ncbi:MAG: MFS transporter [Verrucomicrobia bacterium]|nr:MFS transporter [Verrucomicrobiota bacterium]
MKIRNIIAACSIGNFLEWYDYALYGYLTSILARVFFPSSEQTSALFNTLLIFAIGFIMRPIGSLIFGMIGDRAGRKISLLLSILLMTFPMILMGILPTYVQIGMTAVITLAILRIFQGIPIGGEIGGIMCYLTEIAPAGKKGFFGSWSFLGSQVGFIVSSFEIYAFEKWMHPSALAEWGWRVSFIIGGLLGVFGWYLRRRLQETPAFQSLMVHHQLLKKPVAITFKNYKKQLFLAFCLSSISSGAFYMVFFFSTTFLTDILRMNVPQTLLINTGLLSLSCICMPLFGQLGDRFGIKRLMLISSFGIILLPYFMYYFGSNSEYFLMFLFQTILTLILTINYSLLPAFLAKIFPTQTRYTGVGFAYNLSNAILGGPAPLLSLYLINSTGSKVAPAFYFILLGVISLIPFLYKKLEHAQ